MIPDLLPHNEEMPWKSVYLICAPGIHQESWGTTVSGDSEGNDGRAVVVVVFPFWKVSTQHDCLASFPRDLC